MMKITLNNIEIELTNKINVFIPSKDITDREFDNIKDSIEDIDNLFELYTKDFSHPIKQKEYFLNFSPNKKKLNSNNIFLYCITTNPLLLLWLPEDSCVWKVSNDKIEKFDYIYYKNLTPNTILSSKIFDFEDFIPENDNDFRNQSVEDLYKDEVFYQILDKKLEKLSKEQETLLDDLLD